MAKCCVRKCNSDSRRNYEKLSFFRFPKNEDVKKKWFDIIGAKNIKPASILKICSNHFEENSVNRTLGVVRLKDGVYPTLFPLTSSSILLREKLAKTDKTGNLSAVSKVNSSRNYDPVYGECLIQEPSSSMTMSVVDPLEEVTLPTSTNLDMPLSVNGDDSLTNMRMKTVKVNRIYKGKLPANAKKVVLYLPKYKGRSVMVLEAPAPEKGILKLSKQLQESRKKIKILNQKCRRLARKVLTYRNTIEELKKLHGT